MSVEVLLWKEYSVMVKQCVWSIWVFQIMNTLIREQIITFSCVNFKGKSSGHVGSTEFQVVLKVHLILVDSYHETEINIYGILN